MSRRLRKKNNDKYFDVIPKVEKVQDNNRIIIAKSQALGNLVTERTKILRESRDIRKKLYNLSQEIHSIEQEIAEFFSIEELR